LIWPIFIVEGEKRREEIASMPGVYRYSIDLACEAVFEAASLGIPAVALFPNIDPELRDLTASNATLPDNLVCRATRAIKSAAPNIGVITDVALDPYTSHGHDGLLMEEEIINDATVALLARQAINQAQAGCDIIAPSDMMDGRIGAMRKGLDQHGFQNTPILSYSAKFASAFYGPFRDAAESTPQAGDRKSYQMDSANGAEALREVALDVEEGADMVMVKPGMPYLDIIWRVKQRFQMPTVAYQVSGEYSMLKAAALNGWIDEKTCMMEAMTAFRRAGADLIVTYAARQVARWLTLE
jgi:porphobilinogen synthase